MYKCITWVIAKSVMANGLVALWPYDLRLMSAPKTWMTLEILESSIEHVKHALTRILTIASVQVLLGLHVGCIREHNNCEAIY